jgi:membrane associated rhomboid family serine protease
MTPTQVGMRCPECAGEKTRVIRAPNVLAAQPRVTIALITANVLVFIAEVIQTPSAFSFSGSAYGSLVEKGALIASLRGNEVLGVAHGQLWRLVTSGFLHENILHIAFNMWVLYVFGTMLERVIGGRRLAIVYFVSLLCGSLLALVTTPHGITLGASGAIFGLMGAVVMILLERGIPIMQSGVGWVIVINLVFSFTMSGISWGGHIGGLVGGVLAMGALQLGDRRRSPALGMALCGALAILAVVGSVLVAHASLETGASLLVPTGLVP